MLKKLRLRQKTRGFLIKERGNIESCQRNVFCFRAASSNFLSFTHTYALNDPSREYLFL